MTHVEDFWNIRKVGQTHKFRSVKRYVSSGNCSTPEKITFIYNGFYYQVNFEMYFTYTRDNENEKLTYDRSNIFYICIRKDEQRRNILSNVYYTDDQIAAADLTNMNDPASKAVRAAKYAIENLFDKKASWR